MRITLHYEQENRLLRQIYERDRQADVYPNEINNAVHTMAAHVHRYKAEMEVLEDLATDLANTHKTFCTASTCSLEHGTTAFSSYLVSLALVTSDVKALRKFIEELERKTQTVIALVSSTLQRVPKAAVTVLLVLILSCFTSYSIKCRCGTTSKISKMGTL